MGVLPHAVCVLTAAVALVLYYVALKFLASVSEYKEFTAAQLGVAVFYGLSIAAWAGVEAGFLAARCVGTRRPNAHQTLKTRAQTTVAGKSRDSRQARTLCERDPSVAVLLVRAGARTRPGRRENVSYPRALVCVCTPRASTSTQVARHLSKGAAYTSVAPDGDAAALKPVAGSRASSSGIADEDEEALVSKGGGASELPTPGLELWAR